MGLVLFLLGLSAIVFYFGLRSIMKARDALHWPQVAGEITRSEVRMSRSYNPEDNTTYHALIDYVYVVEGKRYEGDKLRPQFGATGRKTSAEDNAARYPEGAQVLVHVNPDDPTEAYLEVGLTAGSILISLTPTLFLLSFAILVLVFTAIDSA